MRTLVHLAILTAVAGMAPAPLAAQDHDFNISTRSDGPVRSCSDLQMTWDGQPAATSVDTLTATGSDLSVHAPKNGGVYVLGSPGRSDYSISACKAVARPMGRDASAALEKIRPAIAGKSVTRQRTGLRRLGRVLHRQCAREWKRRGRDDQRPGARGTDHGLDDGAGRQRSDPASSTSAGARRRRQSTGPSRMKGTTEPSSCTPRTVPSRSASRAIAGIPGR